MASLMIGRRRHKEEPPSTRRDKPPENTQNSAKKCPDFTVQYLGKLPSRGEYGREYISEPVEHLLKLREKKRRLPKTTLSVSSEGFHFLDHDGPFGKEKHVLIPLHNICYGVADEQSPRVFALITRTDSNPVSSLFECHGFLCDKRKVSSDITYWLLRTFLKVFEDLQRKRRMRQERRQQIQQQHPETVVEGRSQPQPSASAFSGHRDGRAQDGRAMSVASVDKPFEGKSFSLILEGSKERGASVRVALGKQRELPHPQPQSTRYNIAAKNESLAIGAPRNLDRNSTLERAPSQGELISFTADVHPARPPRRPQEEVNSPRFPRNRHDDRNTYVYSGGSVVTSVADPRQLVVNNRGKGHRQLPKPNMNGRYTKNGTHSSHSSGGSRGGTESILNRSTVQDESEFLFIDLLQEEFTDVDGRSRVAGRRGTAIGPPNQTLRSEDIERRICEWLSAREDTYDDEISVFGSDISVPSPRVNYRRQWSRSDTISVSSGDSYF